MLLHTVPVFGSHEPHLIKVLACYLLEVAYEKREILWGVIQVKLKLRLLLIQLIYTDLQVGAIDDQDISKHDLLRRRWYLCSLLFCGCLLVRLT